MKNTMVVYQKKKKTIEKGILYAIIINAFIFLAIPYVTKLSGQRQLNTKTIRTNRVDLIKPELIKEERIREKRKEKKSEVKEIEPIIRKEKIIREPKKVERENLDITRMNISNNLNLKWSPDLKTVPIDLSNFQSGLSDDGIGQNDLNRVFDEQALDEMPRLRFQIKPVYPLVAREMQIEGYVDIEFIVNTDGSVSDIRILESSPTNVFERSAENTVRRWKFTPGKIQGEAVTSRVSVRIDFRISL